MIKFQDVRRYFESPVVDCCNLLRVPYRPENTLDPRGDAASEFVVARLQFGEMSENVVGECPTLENIRGTFTVEYFGPKGRGPRRAQEVMHQIFCSLHDLKPVRSINGPSFTALDERPYYFASLSAAFRVTNIIQPYAPSNAVSCVYCAPCNLSPDWNCGDVTDDLGVSWCDYPADTPLPDPGTAEYDNADITPRSNFGMTCEQILDDLSEVVP